MSMKKSESHQVLVIFFFKKKTKEKKLYEVNI